MPTENISRKPVTTHASSASEAPKSAPIDGSMRLTMSLAMTVTSSAGMSTANKARPEPVRSVVVDVGVIRRIPPRSTYCHRRSYS
jgi:hypothetical protein